MDQIKIGKFIAECRKKQQLTQMQLAEKLNVTDRAVSKWENGKTMPDSSIMLELCHILQISVNDLLNGEVISMENYNKKLEQQLLEMVEQKVENDKKLLTLEWVIGILSLLVLFIPILIASFVSMEEWQKLAVAFSGFIPAFAGFCFAVRIEQIAGYYECQKCKHKYVPSYKATTFAMHMGRTRYLKCPNCNKKSWNKKVLRK